jgi:cold shock CspA family protein
MRDEWDGVSILRKRKRERGQIEKWFEEKGYGFARLGDEMIFIHVSKVFDHEPGKQMLREGSTIEATVITAVKGRQAVDVEVIEF